MIRPTSWQPISPRIPPAEPFPRARADRCRTTRRKCSKSSSASFKRNNRDVLNHRQAKGREATSPPSTSQPHRLRVLFSSASSEWGTPDWLFQRLDAEFGFTLDPCATPANARCRKFFTAQEDGLAQDWSGHSVFMNPPYGRLIGRWMRKAFESSRRGATVVCLVPARTDTNWWHEFAMRGEIRFMRGRLRFKGGKHSAPFPSAVVVFQRRANASHCEYKGGPPIVECGIAHKPFLLSALAALAPAR